MAEFRMTTDYASNLLIGMSHANLATSWKFIAVHHVKPRAEHTSILGRSDNSNKSQMHHHSVTIANNFHTDSLICDF